MEYYEKGGNAVATLLWSSPSQAKQVIPQDRLFSGSNGLKADYFNSVNLTNPALTRTDATVNFDWGTGVPAPGVGVNGFSVRWSGLIEPAYTETYTFYTDSDDGVRLWVNGQLLIDNWTNHGVTEDSATLALVAGQQYSIKMEYYESGGNAVAKLLWSSPSQTKQVIPQDRLVASPDAGNLAQAANTLLEHLAYDLQSDGIIDNAAAGVAIGGIDTAVLMQNPMTLMVPNTTISVGDIASLLDNELSLTNTTTPFYKQDITLNLHPAVLNSNLGNTGSRALTLTWNPSADVVNGYIVYYGLTADNVSAEVAYIPVNTAGFTAASQRKVIDSWNDLRLPIGSNVCFAVRAYNNDGISPLSAPVCSVI